MSKTFITLFLSMCLVGGVQAQETDTTQVEKKSPVIEQLAAKDSVKVEKPDSIPSAPTQTMPTPVAPDEPRIIYYQDSRPEYPNKKDDIKTLSGSMSHSGGFFGVSFRASEFNKESAVLAGFRTGWIINRTLAMGVEGHGIIPTSKFENIDPNFSTVLLGGYGGMFIELIAFSNQVVHVTFPIAGGAGWLGYHEDWDSDRLNNPNLENHGGLVDQDVFWYVEPGAAIEMNISRSFRMAIGLSRRFTEDFELINTRGSEFENMNFFLTLKLGKF